MAVAVNMYPTLKMKWSRFLKFSSPYNETGTSFRNFRNNTIIPHIDGEHKHRGVPVSIEHNYDKRLALIKAKKGRDINYNNFVPDSETPLDEMSIEKQKRFYNRM